MNNEANNDLPSFDLFAPPVDDHLKEELAKGKYQWTNKYTRVLAGAVVVVGLLSVGAWYGHHSATSTSATGLSLNRSGFAAGGFGGGGFATGRSRGTGSGSASAGAAISGGGGFGGGGPRVTGTVSKVANGEVTIKLDDPTQASSLKAGDTTRVTNTSGFGSPQMPTSTSSTSGTTSTKGSPKTTVKSPSGVTPSTKPSITGGNGGSRPGGGFNNPELTACLAKEGVTLTPGTRPDRTDPKIAAAFQKCLPAGFGGGQRSGASGASGAPAAPAPGN